MVCLFSVDRRQESVSVVQDEGEAPSLAGVALAHQVGHNIGMDDDAEDEDHACRCHADTCAMSRHFRSVWQPRHAPGVTNNKFALITDFSPLFPDCSTWLNSSEK